ncbi:inner membrane protein YghB [bacterium BMS3Abin01]|nr:inner membrane protein YghB [bacterium BMS3Abin01]
MQEIIAPLEEFIKGTIDYFGVYGFLAVFFLMTLESACIPIPSEVIMLYAGALVARGNMTLLEATAAGAMGNLVGSWLAYGAGMYGGRPMLEKYGKYILITRKKLDLADRWWQRYGDAAVFFSRLLPIIRTFISLPAGISRMRFGRFTLYTLLGSIPWSLMLAWLGVKFAQNYEEVIRPKLSLITYAVAMLMVFSAIYLVWRWRRRKKLSAVDPGASGERD